MVVYDKRNGPVNAVNRCLLLKVTGNKLIVTL